MAARCVMLWRPLPIGHLPREILGGLRLGPKRGAAGAPVDGAQLAAQVHSSTMEVDRVLGSGEEDHVLLVRVDRHTEPLFESALVVTDLREDDFVGVLESMLLI